MKHIKNYSKVLADVISMRPVTIRMQPDQGKPNPIAPLSATPVNHVIGISAGQPWQRFDQIRTARNLAANKQQ